HRAGQPSRSASPPRRPAGGRPTGRVTRRRPASGHRRGRPAPRLRGRPPCGRNRGGGTGRPYRRVGGGPPSGGAVAASTSGPVLIRRAVLRNPPVHPRLPHGGGARPSAPRVPPVPARHLRSRPAERAGV